MKKETLDLKSSRQAVLDRAKGEVLNIFNETRFARYLTVEHVEALLEKASGVKVLYISREAKLDQRVQALLDKHAKLEVRRLSVDEYDFKTELLVLDASVAISDGNQHLVIDNASFAKDMRQMFFFLWRQAIPCANEQSGK